MSRTRMGGLSFGFLPVDKPAGPTSHDIVSVARRCLRLRKVGHAGTLDPFASGLLLLQVIVIAQIAMQCGVRGIELQPLKIIRFRRVAFTLAGMQKCQTMI